MTFTLQDAKLWKNFIGTTRKLQKYKKILDNNKNKKKHIN